MSPDQVFTLRRYEARLGFWKVVLGTFIVGLAGIIIPAAVNLTTLVFEDWRAEAKLKLEKQTIHQQYIKDFFDTAINQNVELRIRFASYFANLSDGTEKDLWSDYLDLLTGQRQDIRDRINDLEAQLAALQNAEQNVENVIKRDRVSRELNWAYAEIGYVALDRGTVEVVGGKKERLYSETLDVVGRILQVDQPISPSDPSVVRFRELYARDLIGVESLGVELRMVRLRRKMDALIKANLPPDAELAELASTLEVQIRTELRAERQDGASTQDVSRTIQQIQRRIIGPRGDVLQQGLYSLQPTDPTNIGD